MSSRAISSKSKRRRVNCEPTDQCECLSSLFRQVMSSRNYFPWSLSLPLLTKAEIWSQLSVLRVYRAELSCPVIRPTSQASVASIVNPTTAEQTQTEKMIMSKFMISGPMMPGLSEVFVNLSNRLKETMLPCLSDDCRYVNQTSLAWIIRHVCL